MKRKKTWLIVSVLALLLILAGVWAWLYLPGVISRKVDEQIVRLREQGVDLQYDSIHLNVWKNELIIDSLCVKLQDKNMVLRTHSVQLRSLKFFALLFRREIHFRKLVIERPDVWLMKQHAPDSAAQTKKQNQGKPVTLFFDSLRLQNLTFHQTDTVKKDTLGLMMDVRASLITYNNALREPVNFSILQLDRTGATFPDYFLRVPSLFYNRTMKVMEIDSVILQPRFSKEEFARRKRVETDRFDAVFTSLQFRDLNFSSTDSMFIDVGEMKLSTHLLVFRDKHYPFPKRDYVPLPVDALKKIPFPLTIDSIKLQNSFISYEEIGEEADSSGTIFFKDLNATIRSISTDSTALAPVMDAACSFMGKGKLAIHCEFSRTDKPAYLKGSLTSFPMSTMNSMLGPQAKMKIQSGVMTRLNFHFWFNDIRSDGAVDLSYRDLKLLSLREKKVKTKETKGRKKKNEPVEEESIVVKNELMTFVINTLIKTNDGKYVTGEKKPGTILFYRDRKKAVFNFWWKSLFSGIKSSFNLDRLPPPKKKKKE